MYKLVIAAVVGGGFALASFGTASADQIVIDLPQSTIWDGAPGDAYVLATQAVPAEDQGLVCSGDLVSQNNESVHPDNNIWVSTGPSSVVLPDVEGYADKNTPLATPLTLGSDIRVELRMGSVADGIYSGAFRLELQCVQPTPPPPPAPQPTVAPEIAVVAPTPSVGSQGAVVTPAVANPVAQTPAAVAVAPRSGVAPAVAPVGTTQQLPATGPDRTDVAVALGAVLVAAGVSLTALSRRPTGV